MDDSDVISPLRVRTPGNGEYLLDSRCVVSYSDPDGKGVSGKLAQFDIGPGGSWFSLTFTGDGNIPPKTRLKEEPPHPLENRLKQPRPSDGVGQFITGESFRTAVSGRRIDREEDTLPERQVSIPLTRLKALERSASELTQRIRDNESMVSEVERLRGQNGELREIREKAVLELAQRRREIAELEADLSHFKRGRDEAERRYKSVVESAEVSMREVAAERDEMHARAREAENETRRLRVEVGSLLEQRETKRLAEYPRQRVVTEHGEDGSVTIRVELR